MALKKILLIDDEVNLAETLKMNLENTDKFEVRVENKGTRGLAAAKEFMPDLIILDICMPDLGGDELALQIKNDPKCKDIKVIFLTALVEKDDVKGASGVIGGYPFISKSVGAPELVRLIEKHIG